VETVTTPPPQSGQSGLVTTTTYSDLGQILRVTQPDNTTVTNEYHPTGELKKTSGSRAYAFDDIGNRDQTVINGGTTDYTASLLNQYAAVGAASPAHAADGNLTADGTWTNTWDGENRLVKCEKSNQKLEFAYDWQGRRVQKKVFSGSSGNWSLTLERRFVYDGWNLLAIMDGNAALKQQFMWGTDLSGTPQGAGGVGGLVKIYDHSLDKHFFPGYDGNGNIMLLVDGDTGAAAARYEYGPFGEPLSATGTYATANPCRFSTKFTDDETGLLYYGYRYYFPAWGRWASRDPIGEQGGFNVFAFAVNDPVDHTDWVGLAVNEPSPLPYPIDNRCKCPVGSKIGLMPRPNYNPATNYNGCTGIGPGQFDITSACNTHDVCYGTCHSDRAACDRQFLEDMRARCEALYGLPPRPEPPSVVPPGTRPPPRPPIDIGLGQRVRCYNLAHDYYTGVRVAGGRFLERRAE
jgi:RHS repeat-associated protein